MEREEEGVRRLGVERRGDGEREDGKGGREMERGMCVGERRKQRKPNVQ